MIMKNAVIREGGYLMVESEDTMRSMCSHHAEVMLTLLASGKLTYNDVDAIMGFTGEEKKLSHQLLEERIHSLTSRDELQLRIARAERLDQLSRQHWIVATCPPWGSYACQTIHGIEYLHGGAYRLKITGYEDIFVIDDLAYVQAHGPFIIISEDNMIERILEGGYEDD